MNRGKLGMMRDNRIVNSEVIFTAAHAGFPDTEPLGGGKAVADWLIREWRERQSFALAVLSPRSLGFCGDDAPANSSIPALLQSAEEAAPQSTQRRFTETPLHPEPRARQSASLHKPLAEMHELEYARFCRQFERAATAEILRHDPRKCVVLSNDISEGPDFVALGERGYRIVSIFHVDVVDYFTKFYLHGLVKPETAAKFRRFSLLPDMLQLVFQKQFECVRYSARLVVPSAPMQKTILRCYPWCTTGKIVVLPWGDVSQRTTAGRDACATKQFQIAEDEFVILTLSRLSPEKGLDRLLVALRDVETHGCAVRVFICGGPAYMKGQRYARKLRRLAQKLDHIRVEFPGHVTGAEKAALLQRADLFVSPSRHESYGLTIAEAEAAGCRILSHAHYGARGRVVDCGDRRTFQRALVEEIATGRPRSCSRGKPSVASPASPSCFDAAQQLAELLVEVAYTPIP
jgi:glycosyltransferase involved in cell wall biosynthesis